MTDCIPDWWILFFLILFHFTFYLSGPHTEGSTNQIPTSGSRGGFFFLSHSNPGPESKKKVLSCQSPFLDDFDLCSCYSKDMIPGKVYLWKYEEVYISLIQTTKKHH